MASRTRSCERRAAERGFTLAGLIVILTIMMIVIAYTVPEQWSTIQQRQRDRQTIFAMKQYARAIARFQKKHNTLPSSLKQLKDARNPRMMRGLEGLLPDPGSGEADWLLLPVGTPPGSGVAPGLNQNLQPTQPPVMIGAPGLNRPGAGGAVGPAPPVPPQQGAPGSQQLPGGFVGVRPNRKGASFLAFNGKETYEEWTYTVDDVNAEAQARQQALLKK